MSLPPRWHCSIQSSSNAKADSCGVALWLFSIFPSWGLTADLLVKVTDTAIKDLVLIFMFITECWTRGKRAGWAQKDIWAHRHTAGCCPHPAALVSRKAGEAEKLQEICLSGLPLAALACVHKHMDCAGIGLDNSDPFPEQLNASIFCIYLPSSFKDCENLSNKGRRKRTNLPFICAWDFPTRAAYTRQCQYIYVSQTFLVPTSFVSS